MFCSEEYELERNEWVCGKYSKYAWKMRMYLEYFQKTCDFLVFAKLYLNNTNCESIQMASVMSAAGNML